ncbi:MAG: porin [Candidatus Margulisiibacteriota bacterium]
MKKLTYLILLMIIQINGVSVYDRDFKNTRVGGYMDTEWISEGDVNTFRAHRFIIQYGAKLSPRVKFNSEIEYEYGGYVTNEDDSNNTQEGQIKIEQAWVDYQINDIFTLRSGIVLVPVGQLNIYHDSDMRDFTARPLVNYYIIPTTWMDTGVGGHGSIELSDYEITYEAYVINGFNDANLYSTSKGTRNLRPNFKSDTNQSKAISARIGLIPNINTKFGISTYQGSSDQSLVAFDAQYSLGALKLKGEAARYSDGFDNDANGFNIEGKFNIAPYFNLNSQLNLLARYETVDLQANENASGEITRTSFGFNFRPVPLLVYKLEYSLNNTQGQTDNDNTLMASVAVGF